MGSLADCLALVGLDSSSAQAVRAYADNLMSSKGISDTVASKLAARHFHDITKSNMKSVFDQIITGTPKDLHYDIFGIERPKAEVAQEPPPESIPEVAPEVAQPNPTPEPVVEPQAPPPQQPAVEQKPTTKFAKPPEDADPTPDYGLSKPAKPVERQLSPEEHRLTSSIERQYDLEPGVAKVVEPTTPDELAAAEWAKSAGVQAVFVDGAPGDFQGGHIAGNTIAIRSGASNVWRTIGHEVMHALGVDKLDQLPDALVQEYLQKRLAKASPRYRAKMEADPELALREAKAEMGGDFVADPDFRKRLASKHAALYDVMRKAVLKLTGKWKPTDEAQAAILKALRKEMRRTAATVAKGKASELALSDDARKQTRTAAFKKWFGDWTDPLAFSSRRKPGLPPVSQAIDKKTKQPQVLYHGTLNDFNSFEVGRTGTNSNVLGSWDVQRHAVFLAENPQHAEAFTSQGGETSGANVKAVYAAVKSPLDLRHGFDDDVIEEFKGKGFNERWLRSGGNVWELFDEEDGKNFVSAAKELGYDSVVFMDDNPETRDSEVTWAVFSPTQIKSATGNRGTFDASNPDITLSDDTTSPRLRKALDHYRRQGATSVDEVLDAVREHYGEEVAKRAEGDIRRIWDEGGRKQATTEAPFGFTNAEREQRAQERGQWVEGGYEQQPRELWFDKARATLDRNPNAATELLTKLNEEQRPANEYEVAIMGTQLEKLDNAYNEAINKGLEAKAAGDEDAVADYAARVNSLGDEMTAIDKTMKQVSSRSWGRAGVAMQTRLNPDLSLAQMVREARAKVGFRELTETEHQELVRLRAEFAKKIAEADKADGGNEKKSTAASDKAHKRNLKKAKAEQAKADKTKNTSTDSTGTRRITFRVGGDIKKAKTKFASKLAEYAQSIKKVFRGDNLQLSEENGKQTDQLQELASSAIDSGIRSFKRFIKVVGSGIEGGISKEQQQQLRVAWDSVANEVIEKHTKGFTPSDVNPEKLQDLAGLSAAAQQLSLYHIRNGVTEREANIAAVQQDLQTFDPSITNRQTRDAISQYGQFSEPTQDADRKRLAEIRGEMLQLSKIEDMQQGQEPKRTGVGRHAPTEENRRLTKQVNEEKRQRGFLQNSALAAAKKRLSNEIKDLDWEMANRRRIIKNKTELQHDAEYNRLLAERNEKKERNKQLDDPGLANDKKIELAMRDAKRSWDEYERKIAAGEFVNDKADPIVNEGLERLRASRDMAKAVFEELRSHDPQYVANIDRIRTINKRRHLAQRADILTRRMAKGDYARKQQSKWQGPLDRETAQLDKVMREVNEQWRDKLRKFNAVERWRQNIEEKTKWLQNGDKDGLPYREKQQPVEMELSREEYELKKRDELLSAEIRQKQLEKDRSVVRKVFDITGILRNLQAAAEASWIGIQGAGHIGGAVGHLAIGDTRNARFVASAIKKGLHAIASDSVREKSDEGLLTSENLRSRDRGGVRIVYPGEHINSAEEITLTNLGKNIPVGKQIHQYLELWNRGGRVFLNELRTSSYDTMYRAFQPETDAEAKMIGQFVNVTSGYGDYSAAPALADTLSHVFFSPRKFVANIQTALYLPLKYGYKMALGSAGERRVARGLAKELILQVAGLYALEQLAKLAGAKTEDDPRSSNFRKLFWGGNRVTDIWGGLSQAVTLIARNVTGQTKKQNGQIVDITGKKTPFGQENLIEYDVRFLRQKLRSDVALIVDLRMGKDVMGEPANFTSAAGINNIARRFFPITYVDLKDAAQQLGVPKTVVTEFIPSMMGWGSRQYTPPESRSGSSNLPKAYQQLLNQNGSGGNSKSKNTLPASYQRLLRGDSN